MTARNASCPPERFAATLAELVGDIPEAVAGGASKAVTQSARRSAKQLRSGSFGSSGRHEWSAEYMAGFASHVNKSGKVAEGEVGNKNKPGLVHLLEKGHLTLTGRRTQAYPHMAPAFDDMQEDFVKRLRKAVGEALQ